MGAGGTGVLTMADGYVEEQDRFNKNLAVKRQVGEIADDTERQKEIDTELQGLESRNPEEAAGEIRGQKIAGSVAQSRERLREEKQRLNEKFARRAEDAKRAREAQDTQTGEPGTAEGPDVDAQGTGAGGTGGTGATMTDVRAPSSATRGVASGAALGAAGVASVASRKGTFSKNLSGTYIRSYLLARSKVREEQRATKRRERLIARAEAGKLRPPRKLFYFPLIYIAICADVLGIFAQLVNLTGIGAFLISAISICISIFFFIIGVFINRKIKATRNVGEEFNQTVAKMEQRIALLRQGIALAVKYSRRLARKRSFARTTWKRKLFVKAVRIVSKWTKRATKFMRYAQVVLEAIPFINMLPWYTINMVLVYRERKQEYEESMEAVRQYAAADQEEELATGELQEVEDETAADAFDSLDSAGEEDESPYAVA